MARKTVSWPARAAVEPLELRRLLAADVVVSEIMFHPASEDPGEEFIELYNRGDAAANLTGWRFSQGINYAFTGGSLAAGARLVVAANLAKFNAKYPGVSNKVGGWTGTLANSGEELKLDDAAGATVDRVVYADEGDWAVRRRYPEASSRPVDSIARAGTVATATMPGHGFVTGDVILIAGASPAGYNGFFTVTVPAAAPDTFTFTVANTLSTPAGGNITAIKTDHEHFGWQWVQPADGDGPSLELINPGLTNDEGQNWASSSDPDGTPGAANSRASGNVAPLIRELKQTPLLPRSTDAVTVTARLTDESPGSVSADLFYRVDAETPPPFTSIAMRDDGAGGDAAAGDGTWTAVIPPQADGAVVEFYVSASDGTRTRSFPAPTNAAGTQHGANLLYQVDNTAYTGSQPIFRLITTEAERLELLDIGDGGGNAEQLTNAQMNATVVAVDGVGTEIRYNVGVRNRGHGSRLGRPNNYHVDVPSDRSYKGAKGFNLNARYTHSQLLGSAIYRLAGVAAADAAGVEVRVNGTDLAQPGGPIMFGSYVLVEEYGSEFNENHFPDDPNGNFYSAFRTDPPLLPEEADLSYEGPDEDSYRHLYFKETNKDEDDWSDLIRLTNVLNNAPVDGYLQAVSQVLDVDQWLNYLALDMLLLNWETGLVRGVGDDFTLYRGLTDTRFQLVPHDLDSIMNQGNAAGPIGHSIFNYTNVDGLARFLTHPDVTPKYYQALLNQIGGVFNPQTLNPLIDRMLGPFVDPATTAAMKQFVVDRTNAVVAQIPRQLTVNTPLPVVDGFPSTAQPAAPLNGTADASRTRSVLVNGQLANWNPQTGTWSVGGAGGGTQTLVRSGVQGTQTSGGTPGVPGAAGDAWKYLANGSDQGSAWRTTGFNDTAWSEGPSQFGYGDGDENTPVPSGPSASRYVTTYFRRQFTIADRSQVSALTLRALVDDGAVVWLNNNPVPARLINMPASFDYTSRPLNAVTGSGETTFQTFSIDPALLVNGTNQIAVEIHQSANSSDISFDLGLVATLGTASGGVPLNPGINRLLVQAFDGPNGTGNEVQRGFIDVNNTGAAAAPVERRPAAASLSILAPAGYRPGTPVLIQVRALDESGQTLRDLWDANVELKTNRSDVTLSTNQVALHNGLGSVLATVTGSGAFTVTATLRGAPGQADRQDTHNFTSLADATVRSVSGTLSGANLDWSGVIHVTGDVTVPAGSTLTVDPGTLVLIDGVASGTAGTDIIINGAIRSLGTASQPVTFTAFNPAMHWGELRHNNAQPSLYQYTLINKAGRSPNNGGHTGTGPAVHTIGSTVTFDHCVISDHAGKIADSAGGTGGVGSDWTVTDTEFSRSVMGPEMARTALLMDRSWVYEMRNVDDADGIYLYDQAAGQVITIRRSVFTGMDDDGIDTLKANLTIDDVISRGNDDKGISILAGDVNITNTLVVANGLQAEDGLAAAVSAKGQQGDRGVVRIDHSTIVGKDVGVEVRDKFGAPDVVIEYFITNSIVRTPDAVRTDYNIADIHFSYSNVSESMPGTGNVTADPLFVDAAHLDFRLKPGSPSVNAGDPGSPNDPDGSRADQGFYRNGIAGTRAPRTITARTLGAGNFILAPENGPFHVTGDVIIPSGATVIVLPGANVQFDTGTGFAFNGGRLLAEGTLHNQVRITRVPGATGAPWDGLQFTNSTADNRIRFAIVEYGGTTNFQGMIGLTGSRMLLEDSYIDHSINRRIRTENSSLTVRRNEFTDMFPGANEAPTTDNFNEHIWGRGILAGGEFLVEDNVFGALKGHNDGIDWDDGFRPGPIAQIYRNLFKGSGDDFLDLTTDAHIEGNTFMNGRKDQYNLDPGNSNGISASTGDYTVVRNTFINVEHVSIVKEGAFMTFENNTVINSSLSAIYFDLEGQTSGPGDGALVEGSIFVNSPIVFGDEITANRTINRSIVPAAYVGFGTGNTSENPRLRNIAGGDYGLRPGSPAIDRGNNGLDMGSAVPAGASISGEPPATTTRTGATLTVAGPGITHYKFKLNNGAYSTERSVDTPITLSGLGSGTYTVSVIGKDSAGEYQLQSAATRSRTWTVNTSRPPVRLSEVLASNKSAVNHGGFPDLIEIFNEGSSTLDLSGMSITDDPAVPRKYVFPAGTSIGAGQHRILYGDSRVVAGEIHVGFALSATGEGVYLFDTLADGGGQIDGVTFGVQLDDLSIARRADGSWGVATPTFGAANNAFRRTGDVGTLVLNEWLAAGGSSLDDFIELYNPDTLPVDLGGLALTDKIGAIPDKSPIPALSFVAGSGFIAFLCDDNEDAGADHTSFKLRAEVGEFGLFTADGKPIELMVYGPQRTGVSEGRNPDAAPVFTFFPIPTPGRSNVPTGTSNLPLRITEIHYHPKDPASGAATDKDFEFIELQNVGSQSISLNGVELLIGVTFEFPNVSLAPGERIVVVANETAFNARYGAGVNVAGEFDGDLDDSGEEIRLEDTNRSTILDFVYDDDWYPITDGVGHSLVIRNANAAANTWGAKASWRPSGFSNGSPGDADSTPTAAVSGRRVFYNNSAWDGNDPDAGPSDDAAIATDKQALRPGGTATFANYTSFSKGLNGIHIDLLGLTDVPSPDDFEFRVGNSNTPDKWTAAPPPAAIAIRGGAGTGNSDRVTLVWADGAIKGKWLQVTVKATAATGLAAPDVFYFGNAVGESGNNTADARVTPADELSARSHVRTSANPAPINWNWDYNRDKLVNVTDQVIARTNQTTAFTALKLITVPGGGGAGIVRGTTTRPSKPAVSGVRPITGAAIITRLAEGLPDELR